MRYINIPILCLLLSYSNAQEAPWDPKQRLQCTDDFRHVWVGGTHSDGIPVPNYIGFEIDAIDEHGHVPRDRGSFSYYWASSSGIHNPGDLVSSFQLGAPQANFSLPNNQSAFGVCHIMVWGADKRYSRDTLECGRDFYTNNCTQSLINTANQVAEMQKIGSADELQKTCQDIGDAIRKPRFPYIGLPSCQSNVSDAQLIIETPALLDDKDRCLTGLDNDTAGYLQSVGEEDRKNYAPYQLYGKSNKADFSLMVYVPKKNNTGDAAKAKTQVVCIPPYYRYTPPSSDLPRTSSSSALGNVIGGPQWSGFAAGLLGLLYAL